MLTSLHHNIKLCYSQGAIGALGDPQRQESRILVVFFIFHDFRDFRKTDLFLKTL